MKILGTPFLSCPEFAENRTVIIKVLHRGSYMSAHVLLNLLNKLGKKIRCEALPSILLVFPNEF